MSGSEKNTVVEREGELVREGIRRGEARRNNRDLPGATVGLGSKQAGLWRTRVAIKTTIRSRIALGFESKARKLEPALWSRSRWFDSLVIWSSLCRINYI
jgi:hypothetical protein